MSYGNAARGLSRLTLILAVAAVAAGCGTAEPTFTPEEASALIVAQFPEAELEVRTASIDDLGRGVAFARFNYQMVSFFFHPAEEGWGLEAVDFDGSFYYNRDLEQISATMVMMGELAAALESYKAANEGYPAGDTAEVLRALIPDFLAAETHLRDAWEEEFSYQSDGGDYTLISPGADQQRGSNDDIVLHSGEFVGAGRGGGQTQPS
jgi:hypothetical protein